MGDWELASWRMRVDRHVVGVNGVVYAWPLAFRMKRLDLDSLKPVRRHQTLNTVRFWTDGCLVDTGYINSIIPLRPVVFGKVIECIYFVQCFPSFRTEVFPACLAFFSQSLCDIHEQAVSSTLSDICETHLETSGDADCPENVWTIWPLHKRGPFLFSCSTPWRALPFLSFSISLFFFPLHLSVSFCSIQSQHFHIYWWSTCQ